jgi:hypothetical protein
MPSFGTDFITKRDVSLLVLGSLVLDALHQGIQGLLAMSHQKPCQRPGSGLQNGGW